MPPIFVGYVLSIVNADRYVCVIQVPGDGLEGVIELPCPPTSPPNTQVQGALSEIQQSVQATPTPFKGRT